MMEAGRREDGEREEEFHMYKVWKVFSWWAIVISGKLYQNCIITLTVDTVFLFVMTDCMNKFHLAESPNLAPSVGARLRLGHPWSTKTEDWMRLGYSGPRQFTVVAFHWGYEFFLLVCSSLEEPFVYWKGRGGGKRERTTYRFPNDSSLWNTSNNQQWYQQWWGW